jgi:ubiquinone/menaquinone biosynthesis C-methylase UbiE
MGNPPKTALEFFNAIAANYERSVGGSTRDVARYILDILPPISSESVVLDNACGNGIVAQELLLKAKMDGQPVIHCVDGAPGMVDLAKDALQRKSPSASIRYSVAPGENLAFPDDIFTHSVTNMGILFFTDGLKGAREIYRTLKPGGTAIITSWSYLGYKPVIQQAQKTVKPESTPFQVPINQLWFTSEHLEGILREGGFKDIKIHNKEVHYGLGNDAKRVCQLLEAFLPPLTVGWTEEEKGALKEELEKVAKGAVQAFDRPDMQGLVGLPMTAIVAIARK